MVKKTFRFTDFNGNERVEDHYFNLTQAELVEFEVSESGGLTETLKFLSKNPERNGKKILEIFKDLILRSYGVKSADGRRFIKNDEVRDDFAQTEAFSQLLMELATDENGAGAEFIAGLVNRKELNSEKPANLTALPPTT